MITSPARICSLLPSATEIVFALGLEDRLIAVTHECDFPPEASRRPVITRSTLDHETRRSRDIHTHITTALHGGSSIYRLDQDPPSDLFANDTARSMAAPHRMNAKRLGLTIPPSRLLRADEVIQ